MLSVMLLAQITSIACSQTYTVLHSFGCTANADGEVPVANLVLSGETLFGTTSAGGSSGFGTIFRINTNGSSYEVIHHCAFPDAYPRGSIVLSGATLHVATEGGAQQPGPGYPLPEWTESRGSVFSVNTNGGEHHRILEWGAMHYSWLGEIPYGPSDKARPQSGLVLCGDALYGTLQDTVFTVRTNGAGFALLKGLSGQSRTTLTVSGNILFGTTFDGGISNFGTIFALDTGNGDYNFLKQFIGNDGITPEGELLLTNGTLFGTTESGGNFGYGTVYRMNTNGNEFSVLKHFSGSDGAYPHSALVLSGSSLFGTTGAGGQFNHGTVFEITTNGSEFAVLKHFIGEDGAEPYGGMVLSNGTLYGTTVGGGEFEKGVLFSLSLIPSLINPACDGTNFMFCFQTVSNLSYVVESTDDPFTPDWQFHHEMTGDGSMMPCVVPMTNDSQRFFRVRQP